ncbi:hypothetical protein V6N11_036768 [Hibiscus sabdariffa]|uniref:Uncharacterized protein n=1 Tax=Hibiscus sabdariffa TaxID=183260 RepID=A0ABR2RBB2_9ROSI
MLELELTDCRESESHALESNQNLQAELLGNSIKTLDDPQDDKLLQQNVENEDIQKLNTKLNFAKLEVGQLRSALDAAEVRYQEEYIRSTLQIRGVYEQVEHIKEKSCQREVELEEKLKKMKADIDELRANLMDKETEKRNIFEENEGLNLNIDKNRSDERES